MHGLQQLLSSDLPIPLWQIVFYVGFVSYFMIQRWFKLSFLTSFIVVLYWLHYAFRTDLVAITNEAHLARAIYYVLGFALILVSIFALTFLEVDADSLLEKREKEIALLKAQAKNAEKTASALQEQIEKDEGQDTNAKKREKKLTAEIEKLQKHIENAEGFLETRDTEIAKLKSDVSEAQKNAAAFEALLDMFQTQEANAKKQLEDDLNTKIEALQLRLNQGESLLEERNAEIAASQLRAAELEANFARLEERLRSDSSSPDASIPEEELRAQITQLKDELSDKVSLLEKRNAEIAELQVRASGLETNAAFKSQLEIKLAEASTDARNREEELRLEIDQLTRQLKESEALLNVRTAEVAEFRTKASAADKNAAALKVQLDKDQSQSTVSRKKLEEKLNARIARLENQLKQGEALLEKRDTEIAELQTVASHAEKKVAADKAQFEKQQTQAAVASRKVQEELSARVATLEVQLKDAEDRATARGADIMELQARASQAETEAARLRAQSEKEKIEVSVTTEQRQEEFDRRIHELEDKLKQGETLLEKRDLEIAQFQAQVVAAEKRAMVLEAELEKVQSNESTASKKVERELSAKIVTLEEKLRGYDNLLANRSSEIAHFRAQATEAERSALVLKAELEKAQSNESAANRKVEKELNAKIVALEDKLREYDTLLANRNSEIGSLQAKALQAEKHAEQLSSQLEETAARASIANRKLEEEFHASRSQLEDQLNDSKRLLETRDGEVAELKATAVQAEKRASALQVQLEKETQQVSSATKKADELNARISKLENQLKEGETALKARNSEIAALQAKAAEAEKAVASVKGQLEKQTSQASSANKKVETELNAKIAKLGNQLKESESLLEKRNAEIAELKSQAAEMLKAAKAAKPNAIAQGPVGQVQTSDDKDMTEDDVRRKLHQFQHAVKYLEDEIKEKDRLLSLMAKKNAQTQSSTKNAVDEDLKKKVHQLEQAVKYLENQSKEKDGLLGLMAKRNRELADLKSKAEEKLEALAANTAAGSAGTDDEQDIATER
jgi:chromosome segregation ATPase